MMRSTLLALANASAAIASAASLSSVCTNDNIIAALPPDDVYLGITIDRTYATSNVVTNSSVTSNFFPDAVIDYCNVTVAYSHTDRDDRVLLQFFLPAPSNFQNRWLSNGGGGLAIYAGEQSIPGGVIYGAVSGATDGGFGSFATELDGVLILANGTINWESVFMFGYQAHHEMSTIGKAFSRLFYNMTDSEKLYAYYEGCSEGGREGWSQIQRYGDEWDGAVVGAPAFRFSHQQVNHLFAGVVEKTLDYYPPPCEMDKILNLTIAACDPLDGRSDGVVSRSDLCKLKFDLNSTIGQPYYCAASSATGVAKRQAGGATLPAQNGTVTAQGVAVYQAITDGLKDSQGRQAYLSYALGAALDDAETSYNSTSGTWYAAPGGIGGEFVAMFLDLLDETNIDSLDGVTYDTLVSWMWEGWQMYQDTLQTTWPDLTPWYESGAKIIHFHGESDFSIPTASSVYWYESVRQIMYPGLAYNDSTEALGDWYRLYLVPGAGHCAVNDLQPNGPFPQTNLAVMIDWVENGVKPVTLNATVLQGANEGENQQLCAWPLRPLWSKNGTDQTCVYDQASLDTWKYNFDAFKLPVY